MKDSSLWLVSSPADSDPHERLEDLRQALGNGKLGHASLVEFPEFKTGTLSSLLTLSETLGKQDPTVTTAVQKTVDTIRSLTSPSSSSSGSSSSSSSANPQIGDSSRASPLSSHLVLDDGRPYLSYVFPEEGQSEHTWTWDKSKFRTESRSLNEVVEAIMKEVQSIENSQRNKNQEYAVVKGQLTQALRKKSGNLSMRSLADVVSASDFAGTNESEYLETVLVAVPKNLTKEWDASYERLTQMVVPRSSVKLAEDEEYVLFSVTIFRRIKDEFSQKAREKKFIARDFTYDEEAIQKGKRELEDLIAQEKQLWGDLLRLSRINFSELFQLLVHLKVVRTYVESVLRYGLPAAYFGAVIKPEHKQHAKLISTLSDFLVPDKASRKKDNKKKDKSGTNDEAMGEYASVMEGEYYEFVVFEIEKVDE
ncbi:H(+)-transporting V1 sector ATPase subunit C [Sporobolomyces salmoneus]|uniref:H(+)-transporting V1 sector ATPase subunit C n=1 Tax=Sporobolomyces salmoneus TaxID=183962 RepID=UPI00317DB2C3